jgi:hypothetical protein
MSLNHSLVTLNTTTATILTIPADQEDSYSSQLTISIQNLNATHFVFLGNATVSTSSYGFRIDPGQTFTAVLAPQDEIYAVTDTGTTNVGVIRVQH